MDQITKKHCIPCTAGTPPLTEKEIEPLIIQVADWEIIDNKRLFKSFKFKDFRTAIAFVNRTGEIAEAEAHHPDIRFTWGIVEITLYTHKINGLSENDFIMAARISQMFNET